MNTTNRAGMPVPVNNPPVPTVPLVCYQGANQPPANVVVINNPPVQPRTPEPQPMYQQAQQYMATPVQQAPQYMPPPVQQTQQYMTTPVQQAPQYMPPPVQQTHQPPTGPDPSAPQPFTPADPDPNREYWFRKHNGQYITLTRYAIDQMSVVWYCKPDGSWYAVHA
ncbi:hypothetical protein QBC39DRAFT_341623 [Podospora conica]|nr:hypothetical protein QBC39DRAFT_341623 [Schizothecium conicum]